MISRLPHWPSATLTLSFATMSKHLARRTPTSQQCDRLVHALLRQPCPIPVHHHPRRALSTTRILQAGTSTSRPFRSSSSSQPAQPSLKNTQQKQIAAAIRSGEGINEDMGVLPETLIFPTGRNRPTLSPRNLGVWTRMLRAWAGLRVREGLTALLYRYWWVRPRPTLEYGSVARTAARLHAEMYAAFARGELEGVRETLCPGIFGSLQQRITQRPPGVRMRWVLVRHVKSPTVVSFKAVVQTDPQGKVNPKTEQIGLKQAVVRIHSVQSLQHVRRFTVKEGDTRTVKEEVLGAPTEKESVEYLVVQKMLFNSREQSWKVWGSTQESLPEVFAKKAPKKMKLKAVKAA